MMQTLRSSDFCSCC